MNTNHGGYTESPWVTELRNQKRKAVEFAYEVFNASTLTDDEIKALDAALEACATDPAHIINAEQFPFDAALADTWQGTEKRIAFADWSEPSEEYKNEQPYHNDMYPYL